MPKLRIFKMSKKFKECAAYSLLYASILFSQKFEIKYKSEHLSIVHEYIFNFISNLNFKTIIYKIQIFKIN